MIIFGCCCCCFFFQAIISRAEITQTGPSPSLPRAAGHSLAAGAGSGGRCCRRRCRFCWFLPSLGRSPVREIRPFGSAFETRKLDCPSRFCNFEFYNNSDVMTVGIRLSLTGSKKETSHLSSQRFEWRRWKRCCADGCWKRVISQMTEVETSDGVKSSTLWIIDWYYFLSVSFATMGFDQLRTRVVLKSGLKLSAGTWWVRRI